MAMPETTQERMLRILDRQREVQERQLAELTVVVQLSDEIKAEIAKATAMPHIRIDSDGRHTRVWIDGVEKTGLHGIEFRAAVGDMPQLDLHERVF